MSRMVIDVSSRDSSPSRNNARGSKPRTRSKRAVPPGDIIELTDSDSEVRPGPSQRQASRRSNSAAVSQQRKEKRKAEPVAGPSGVRNAEPPLAAPRPPTPPVPLFLPDLDDPLNLNVMAHFHAYAPAPEPVAPPEAAVPLAEPEAESVREAEMVADEDVPFDAYVAQVLEIIPDVLSAHVFSLIEQHYPNAKAQVVETVLHVLFENPDYPKADAKGKRKRDEPPEQRAVRPKVDYGDKNRVFDRGTWYTPLALEQLEAEFVDIPTAHIRQMFLECNLLYAPTYLALVEQQRSNKHDDDLEREMQWVREKLDEEEAKRAAELEEELRLQEEGGIECGCCFSEYPFDKMVQCPEAHLFCTTCMLSYAGTKLGEHDARIVCMDQSGCKLPFPDSELRRFLSPKLLELYERVKQRKEIEAAGLEGLEECPFCEYKVVIENEAERLFRCENEACGAVTCRKCKKLDHLPKSCQEVDDDKKLGVRHAIEEAMTAALMRNCPKCNKAFIKEMGCNKMTCPNCGTLSCYICRKVIVGYDHFSQPPPYDGRPDLKKCTLWDASVEGRHSDEVTAAAKRALDKYKRAHPELDEKDIAVELPPPPPAAGHRTQGTRTRTCTASGADRGAHCQSRKSTSPYLFPDYLLVTAGEFLRRLVEIPLRWLLLIGTSPETSQPLTFTGIADSPRK
ncbi:hypothetical protein C8T65DRAFT_739128 [Cerioporus squamosus]|nr:hypothetical protein C8T65DRAFT_739128 [Cerioporus squamosus]